MMVTMKTVIETPEFIKQAARIWSDEERTDFITFIAENPLAGDVIPQAEGARKVRWVAKGKGKRSGARVVYINVLPLGVLLLAVYAKNEKENMQSNEIKRLL